MSPSTPPPHPTLISVRLTILHGLCIQVNTKSKFRNKNSEKHCDNDTCDDKNNKIQSICICDWIQYNKKHKWLLYNDEGSTPKFDHEGMIEMIEKNICHFYLFVIFFFI